MLSSDVSKIYKLTSLFDVRLIADDVRQSGEIVSMDDVYKVIRYAYIECLRRYTFRYYLNLGVVIIDGLYLYDDDYWENVGLDIWEVRLIDYIHETFSHLIETHLIAWRESLPVIAEGHSSHFTIDQLDVRGNVLIITVRGEI